MICKICQSEGKKSRVQSLGCSTTLMGCSPYYDEDGKYHYHDYNTSNCGYRCSEGHTWSEKQYNSCPSCDWTNKPAELVDEEEQHVIQDMKVSQLCQKEDMEFQAGIGEEERTWMSQEESMKWQVAKDEMAKKVLSGEVPYEGYPDIGNLAEQMKPLQDNVWRDLPDSTASGDVYRPVDSEGNPVSLQACSEEEWTKWAEQELAKIKLTPEDEKKSFTDMLMGKYVAGIDPIHSPELMKEMVQKADEYSKGKFDEQVKSIAKYYEGIEPLEIDAIASKRIVDEYDQKTAAVNQDAPQSYNLLNLMNEKPPVYEQHWATRGMVDEKKYKELEAKVLQWYKETGDEKFREHMGIPVKQTEDGTGTE